MQKVSRRQQFMLTLPGLLLFAAFLIGGGAEALIGEVPGASAMETHSAENLVDCSGETRKPSFGSAVIVSSGEVICGNVTSFGGEIIIHGMVKGDVVAFGSDIVIDGNVQGTVYLYGGNLTLQDGMSVNGDIHICGGHWIGSDYSHLHGNVFDCTKDVGFLLVNDVGASFRFWYTLTLVLLGLLLTTLLPEHVMLVRSTAKIKMRRSTVLGLLSILLAPVIILVLMALIISIPLAILITVGLIAAWALGTVAVGWHIGDYVMRKIAPQQNSRLMQVAVGLALLALAETMPYVGWLIILGTGLLGLGAVFLSRFGTRIYSQPKQPLPL